MINAKIRAHLIKNGISSDTIDFLQKENDIILKPNNDISVYTKSGDYIGCLNTPNDTDILYILNNHLTKLSAVHSGKGNQVCYGYSEKRKEWIGWKHTLYGIRTHIRNKDESVVWASMKVLGCE